MYSAYFSESIEQEVTQRPENIVRGMRFNAHLIRTSKECWCDKLVREQMTEVTVNMPCCVGYLEEMHVRYGCLIIIYAG